MFERFQRQTQRIPAHVQARFKPQFAGDNSPQNAGFDPFLEDRRRFSNQTGPLGQPLPDEDRTSLRTEFPIMHFAVRKALPRST
jgi:hypothetical protein